MVPEAQPVFVDQLTDPAVVHGGVTTAVQVTGLIEDEARVEIDVTAVIPG